MPSKVEYSQDPKACSLICPQWCEPKSETFGACYQYTKKARLVVTVRWDSRSTGRRIQQCLIHISCKCLPFGRVTRRVLVIGPFIGIITNGEDCLRIHCI